MSRAAFLQKTAAVALATPASSLASAPDVDAIYPSFSWDTVPCVIDVAKSSGNFSASEIDFLAHRFAYVAILPGQATGIEPKGSPRTEVGFERAAVALRQSNPLVKTLFYWNSYVFYDLYAASKSFDPAWGIPGKGYDGRTIVNFDTSNRNFREWWIRSAAAVIDSPYCDGAFIDAIDNANYSPYLHDMLAGLRDRVRRRSGKEILMIGNEFVQPPASPLSYFDQLQGQMLEHFDILSSTSPDTLRANLLGLALDAKLGKVIHFKGWPRFTFLEPRVAATPYAELVTKARADIEFPLACFLAIAGKYSYFQYSWGYTNLSGSYILEDDLETVDHTWYPELRRPLGPPLADAEVDGYIFTRSFQFAHVYVDLFERKAKIFWCEDENPAAQVRAGR